MDVNVIAAASGGIQSDTAINCRLASGNMSREMRGIEKVAQPVRPE